MSSIKDTAVLVISCAKYSSLWRPFFELHRRYWPTCDLPLYLASERTGFEFEGVTNIAYGADLSYSENLLRALGQVPQEWIIFWMEDRPLSAPVDEGSLTKIIDAAKHKSAVYLKLIPEHPIAYESPGWIGQVPPGTPYRVSLTVCLWRKAFLVKFLKSGETAWLIERRGSVRSDVYKYGFFGLGALGYRSSPLRQTHLIIQGALTQEGARFLCREGFGSILANWRRLPIYRELYVLIYRIVMPVRWRALRWRLLRKHS